MAWDYTDKVKDLFKKALTHELGSHLGKLDDYDAMGENGSIVCGDAIKFYLKLEKNIDPLKDRIVRASYETFGCTSAIASSEALCLMLEELKPTPIESLSITNKDIVKFLGGMPQAKIHCSVMGAEVLRSAVIDWGNSRKIDLSPYLPDFDKEEQKSGEILCECFNLTKPYVRKKIMELNLKTLQDVEFSIKAGGACGRCKEKIAELLNSTNGPIQTKPLATAKSLESALTKLDDLQDKFKTIRVKEGLIYLEALDDDVKGMINNKLQENIQDEFKTVFI